MSHDKNFFDYYFDFVNLDEQEAPANCHRWAVISMIAAMLGRNYWTQFGRGIILPNQYIQIIGLPASRKSTAIKLAKSVLKAYGYTNFAPEKTSLEKFLIDLHDLTWGEEGTDTAEITTLDENIFGTGNPKERAAMMEIANCYIANDEFVDFIGRNNVDFISLLGTFWDYRGVFDRKLKHSKAVYINEPTVNIIAGNTPSGFNAAFPPEIQGQGFFSRLLLIHAEPTGKKIHRPAAEDAEAASNVLRYIQEINKACIGEAIIPESSWELLKVIYEEWIPINDHRFEHYSGRRYTHLLKLSLVMAAMRCSMVIDEQDIIFANTILQFAEYNMPKAMGEFGRSKNSIVAQKVLEIIYSAKTPVKITQLMKHVVQDIDNISALQQVIEGLKYADKIDYVTDIGFIPKRVSRSMTDSKYLKPSLLLKEELAII